MYRHSVPSVSFYCRIIVWNLLNKDNNTQRNKIDNEKRNMETEFLATDHIFDMNGNQTGTTTISIHNRVAAA